MTIKLIIIDIDFISERNNNIILQLTKDYKVYISSNKDYKTTKQILYDMKIINEIDYFITNENYLKIYMKCIIRAGVIPRECIILNKSNAGEDFGYHVINSIEDIINRIEYINLSCKNISGKINILIPMAGDGSRFKQVGYKFPKPLIDVNGKPMIQKVVENLNCDPHKCRYIFIVKTEHYETYNLKYLLNLIAPNCIIIQTDGLTEGAACSSLLAEKYIDNDEHLLFANSDQILEWNVNEFLYKMTTENIDGGISTFIDNDKKWSYAKIDNDGFVTEVAEKNVISEHATTGIYYYNKGSDFVKYAKQMIQKNKRINNEFYVCPVFNEMISDNKKIKIFPVQKMWGVGTPTDLNVYLENNKI